jgi:glycosyltransferase involved in cell wall biosynthesis
MKKLAVIITHPVQYYAPVFNKLSENRRINPKVFYTWPQSQGQKYDPGFKRVIEWDIPLLDGYDYEFVDNIAPKPGSNHFNGIVNPELNHRIEAWKPDALLVIGWSYRSHLQAMRHFKSRIPVLFRGDSNLLDESHSLKTPLRRAALWWVYRHVDKALYVGEQNKRYFLKHGLKPSQLHFAPHAVDNARFADSTNGSLHQVAEWRDKLRIAAKDFVFLFAGKLESKKDPVALLQAFQAIGRRDVHLVFVGNGVLEDRLRSMAGNSRQIHFLPFQNQSLMPAVYRLGDVFVLPSKGPGETWGLAVNEAMASGRPVLVSDKVGCAVDLVAPGKNGYVFNAGDIGDLVGKMLLLFNNWQNLENMGCLSQQMIQPWSLESLAESIENATLGISQVRFA